MKIIIASGFAANTRLQDIISAERVDFIQKPYRIEILSEKIRSILDQKVISS